MKGQIWIKRAIAASLALAAIGYAGYVYKQQFGTQQLAPPPIKRAAQAAKVPSPKPSPATRPTTTLVSRKLIATRPAPGKEPGETERIDPWHPSEPNDPFRITRATRHIDGPTDTVRAAALSRDKTKLVVGGNDRMIRLFDFASGKELHHFEGHTAFILGVDISSDGKRIISCGEDKTVRVWETDSGEQIAEMEHQGDVTGAAFLSDPNQAISTSRDGTACFWDIDKEKAIKKIDYQRHVCAMAVCLPANLAAIGTHNGAVYLWDLKTRSEIRRVETVPGCIVGLAFSADGKRLVIQPAMQRFRVVEVASGKTVFQEPQDQWDRVWSIALSADGNTLALGRGYQVIFWNLQTFERHKTYLNPNADAHAMCFVPDTAKFVVAGGGFEEKGGGWMRPWDDTILIFTLPQPLP